MYSSGTLGQARWFRSMTVTWEPSTPSPLWMKIGDLSVRQTTRVFVFGSGEWRFNDAKKKRKAQNSALCREDGGWHSSVWRSQCAHINCTFQGHPCGLQIHRRAQHALHAGCDTFSQWWVHRTLGTAQRTLERSTLFYQIWVLLNFVQMCDAYCLSGVIISQEANCWNFSQSGSNWFDICFVSFASLNLQVSGSPVSLWTTRSWFLGLRTASDWTRRRSSKVTW